VRHNRERCWYGRPRCQLDHQPPSCLRLPLHPASDFSIGDGRKSQSLVQATCCFSVQFPCPHGEQIEASGEVKESMKRERETSRCNEGRRRALGLREMEEDSEKKLWNVEALIDNRRRPIKRLNPNGDRGWRKMG
jgi:hypothetical protein